MGIHDNMKFMIQTFYDNEFYEQVGNDRNLWVNEQYKIVKETWAMNK